MPFLKFQTHQLNAFKKGWKVSDVLFVFNDLIDD